MPSSLPRRCWRGLIQSWPALALVPVLLLWPWLTYAQAQRIVSLNVCTDQFLLLLAERQRIASITWLSADPEESPLAEQARGIALNYGQAEDIIPLQPDLILAGTYTARFTVELLRQRGYRMELIPPAVNLAQLSRSLRQTAELIGARDRGEALLAEFERELQTLAPIDRVRPSALLYAGRGYTAGVHSLETDLLTAVGLRNQAAELGLDHSGFVDLERLLSQPPDLLVISRYHRGNASLATRLLQHPALQQGLRDRHIIELPARLLSCTPSALLEVARRLHAARARILARDS